MYRLTCFLILVAIATSAFSQTVYITKTGKSYHVKGCTSLRKSAIPIELSEAIARYSPCRNCNPPTEVEGAAMSSLKSKSAATSSRKEQSSGRCQARTKKGTQCSRRAQPGSKYCWQHNK
jgi:hypothetical protein